MVNYGPIEICFLVDLGITMEKWWKIFKKVAIHEVQKFHDDCRGYIKVKAAFIGYRTNIDFQPIVIIEFTSNLLKLQQQINQIFKNNTPHQCKSLSEAMECANNLKWQNYAGGILILIGDSPTYGIKYHDQTIYDLYPCIKPSGIPLECIIERLAFKGVNLIIFQMHESMDIMVNIIEKAYNNTSRHNKNEITILKKVSTETEFEKELISQIHKHLFNLADGN